MTSPLLGDLCPACGHRRESMRRNGSTRGICGASVNRQPACGCDCAEARGERLFVVRVRGEARYATSGRAWTPRLAEAARFQRAKADQIAARCPVAADAVEVF